MEERTLVLALKLLYQLYQASVNNPSLAAFERVLEPKRVLAEASSAQGLPAALALMVRASRARSKGSAHEAMSVGEEAAALAQGSEGCATRLALLRAILDTVSLIAEIGEEALSHHLETAERILAALPQSPSQCPDTQDIVLLYYPARDPEAHYRDDLVEMKAFTHYIRARLALAACKPEEATSHALKAAEALAWMIERRPYYAVHNLILLQTLIIKAAAQARDPCNQQVQLIIPVPPGPTPEKTTLTGAHRAARALYMIAAAHYPNTIGQEALDGLYHAYKTTAEACGEEPEPPIHNTPPTPQNLESSKCEGPETHCLNPKLQPLACI